MPTRAHLVLEQLAERLDELEPHALGQAADVVVALDRGRLPDDRHALDDVGIERALRQEVEVPELARARLEHVDERRADDLALRLGVGDAAQPIEEHVGRVHEFERQPQALEARAHLRGLVQAQQAVVDEDAGQSIADRAVQQHGRHRRVHAARQAADDPPLAHRRPNPRRCSRRRTTPSSSRPCSRTRQTRSSGECRCPPRCARPPDGTAARSSRRAGSCMAATGALAEVAATRNPGGAARRNRRGWPTPAAPAARPRTAPAPFDRVTTACPYSRLWGTSHPTAEHVGQHLHAVADAQRRHAEIEHRRRPAAARPSRAPNADRPTAPRRPAPSPESRHRRRAGHDLAVHRQLAQTPRDQLGVLRPEIENKNRLMCHA